MTDKELKRLSRAELLEMLLVQVEENKELKTRLDGMQAQLDSRQIMLNKAGSIAEAALPAEWCVSGGRGSSCAVPGKYPATQQRERDCFSAYGGRGQGKGGGHPC